MLGLKVRRMLLMGEEKHHVSLPSWSQGYQRILAGHWSYTTGPFILNFIRQTAICFWGDESLSQSTKKLFLVHRIWESEGERERFGKGERWPPWKQQRQGQRCQWRRARCSSRREWFWWYWMWTRRFAHMLWIGHSGMSHARAMLSDLLASLLTCSIRVSSYIHIQLWVGISTMDGIPWSEFVRKRWSWFSYYVEE